MRAIFFGTPDFAVPSLCALCSSGLEIALVVCQPDRPAGRGLKLTPPPVKVEALRRGIPVEQPHRLRDPETLAALAAARPDVCIVAAFGRIFPKTLLDLPRLGCINVHASILPLLRGAAPIHWAIIQGLTHTGVTLMRMDEGMDAGPVYATATVTIAPDETAGTLHDKLAAQGARLLADELPRILARERIAVPQDHARATLAPKLDPQMGRLDFARDATTLDRLVRGLSPFPGAYTTRHAKRLKLLQTHVLTGEPRPAHGPHAASEPAAARLDTTAGSARVSGALVATDDGGLAVCCGSGWLAIDRVQLEGARPMTAGEHLRGHPLIADERLGESVGVCAGSTTAAGHTSGGPGAGAGAGEAVA